MELEVTRRRIAHAGGRPVRGYVTVYRAGGREIVVKYKLAAPPPRAELKLAHVLEYSATGEPVVTIIEWGGRP